MGEMEARIQSSFPNVIRLRPLSGWGQVGHRKQDGAIAVVSAVVIVGLIGFCGLALDLAVIYNRKVEMLNIADAAALGAARRLNGTAVGINDAVAAAETAATAIKYQYNHLTINWSASAIKFSTSPDRNGNWVDAGTAAATPARIFFVKVDTSPLDGAGDVQPFLMPVLSSAFATVTANSDAIAGRTTINVAPLAICAMSPNPAGQRNNTGALELVQYGFRRGISYDLMQLNPDGLSPANFVVNPLAPPGTPGLPADVLPATVGPYMCTGTLGIPRIVGDTIAVSGSFPLGSLYKQLNSRFDKYDDSLCNFRGAPPDTNIQSYDYTKMSMPGATFPWLTTAPTSQTAASWTGRGKLETIADVDPPAGTAAQHGPLWANAKAVPYTTVSEPSNGYTPFTTASWQTLYGGQKIRTYPSPSGTLSPYKQVNGANFFGPSAVNSPGVKGRRILNVPLLACPVPPGGGATVLAIGKFFMTVPATATILAAEFAGTLPLQNVEGEVGLFP